MAYFTVMSQMGGTAVSGDKGDPALSRYLGQVNFATDLVYPYFTRKRPVTGTRLRLNQYRHRNVRVRTKFIDVFSTISFKFTASFVFLPLIFGPAIAADVFYDIPGAFSFASHLLRMPTTSRCGLPLPLPDNFDLVAHMTHPGDVFPSFNMELLDKNAENICLEKSNRVSVAHTRAYIAAAASLAGIENRDVGATLEPFLAYTEEEKDLLVASKEVAEVTGPLPVFMTMWIAGERVKVAKVEAAEKVKRDKERSDKEAEKSKATCPIGGTQLMVNPRSISAASTGPVDIPDLWNISLHHKIYLPLHFWSDKILRRATNFPFSIPLETVTARQVSALITPPSIRVVNVKKATDMLGEEDCRASINQLESFKYLCPLIDATNPAGPFFTNASEYEKYVLFFVNLDCFENLDLFPVWYPVEYKLRYTIYKDGLFNHMIYESCHCRG
ncbi:hypothetical protein DFH09DRAFT_1095344 [Mycena vulgaris]|nr:hypothetical protein DFH09DRAFT_1095344 [Mycena vulgaris]